MWMGERWETGYASELGVLAFEAFAGVCWGAEVNWASIHQAASE